MVTDRPIGTWFWTELPDYEVCLWQQCEEGPMEIGILYSQSSADFICEKLNEIIQ